MNNEENVVIDQLYKEYSELFFTRLREAISIKGANITKIAEQLCLSTVTLHKYLKGVSFPININEKLLCHLLQVDPRYFYDKSITLADATHLFLQSKSELEKLKTDIALIKQKLYNPNPIAVSDIKQKTMDLITDLPDSDIEKIYSMIKVMFSL